MRRTPAIVTGTALLALAGCNSTPVYPHELACSMDAEAVAELLDTDRYTAEDEQLFGTPFTPFAFNSPTGCVAKTDDRRVIVNARMVPQETAEDEVAGAQAAETSFEYRGGYGDTTIRGISWTCGNVSAVIYVLEEPETQPDWKALAEPVWDQIGCLVIDDSGEKYIPDGWP